MQRRLAPGRLAHLISALYEAAEGTNADALRNAAAGYGLRVLTSTSAVPSQDNRYNLCAALLAADPTGQLTHLFSDRHNPISSTNSSTRFHTAAAGQQLSGPTKSQHHISAIHLHCHTAVSGQWQGSNLPIAAQACLPSGISSCGSSNESKLWCSTTGSYSSRSTCGGSGRDHISTAALDHSLLSAYIIITGISGGYDQHVLAARQLYSQSDFFVYAQPGTFWHKVMNVLNHGPAVPDLIQQPVSSIIEPWVTKLYQVAGPGLAEQGYRGMEIVLSGHSLGGFIADSAGLMLSHSCQDKALQFSSVTFDSPGIPAAVVNKYGTCLSTAQTLDQEYEFETCNNNLANESVRDNLPHNAASQPIIRMASSDRPPSKQQANQTAPSVAATLAVDTPTAAHPAAVAAPGCSLVSYLASPTPLNTLFRHPGVVYYVPVDSQEQNSMADVVMYTAIDAARCFFLWGIFCHLVGIDPSTAAAAAAVGDTAAATTGALTDVAAATSNAAHTSAGVDPGAARGNVSVTVTASLPVAAVIAGIFGSVAGRLGLGAVELVEQHSLQGIRCRAFEPSTGDHRPGMVHAIASWPLFTPGAEIRGVVVGLLLGVMPSFLWPSNRGVLTLWEGKAAQSKRALQHLWAFHQHKQSGS